MDNLLGLGFVLGHAHISRKRAVWDPLRGSSWGGLLEHAVDLLKREALSLWDEEVGIDEAGSAERAPNEEDLTFKSASCPFQQLFGEVTDEHSLHLHET